MNETEQTTSTERDIGYLRTPARNRAPAGYRPAYATIPEAFDHEHRLDTYQTADVVYCTLCGTEW